MGYIYWFTWLLGVIFSVAIYIVFRFTGFELTLNQGIENVDLLLLGVAMFTANIPVIAVTFGYWFQAELTKKVFLWSAILALFFCYFVIGAFIGLDALETKYFISE